MLVAAQPLEEEEPVTRSPHMILQQDASSNQHANLFNRCPTLPLWYASPTHGA